MFVSVGLMVWCYYTLCKSALNSKQHLTSVKKMAVLIKAYIIKPVSWTIRQIQQTLFCGKYQIA